MKTWGLLVFLCFALCGSISAQNIDLKIVQPRESFTCVQYSLCCGMGIELGEEQLIIIFKDAILTGNKLSIRGKVTNDFDSIAIILGYGIEDKICPVEPLSIITQNEKSFSLEFEINNSSVLYFYALSFQASVFYVGRLLK